MAKKIMLIRHAEKPNNNGSIRGVAEDGGHDESELLVRGWQRAGALIRFFAPASGAFSHPALATPDAIFACPPHGHIKSARSEHTVQPLALFLNKAVNLDHKEGEEDKLVEAVTATSGVVLIAWEHNAIPDIAARIVGNRHKCPRKWPDSRFDMVWVLDHKPAPRWTFAQAPQLVLPGDHGSRHRVRPSQSR
jgi:hypothetical protein